MVSWKSTIKGIFTNLFSSHFVLNTNVGIVKHWR